MKKVIAFAVALLILSTAALPCFAQIESKYIIDDADLLSDYEEQYLLTSIENLQTEYGYDVVIHTTNSTYGQDIASYCDDYYDNGGFAEDGLIFVINMGERDYYTSTCGTLVDLLPYYQIEDVSYYLSSGDYFTAFSTYLNSLAVLFAGIENAYASQDTYYDDSYKDIDDHFDDFLDWADTDLLSAQLPIIIGSVVIAFLITTVIKKKMNTAVKQRNADSYMVNGSFNLTNRRDVLVGSNIVKKPIPKNNTGSRPGGGGGGVRVSSGGVRHGGGGGKF